MNKALWLAMLLTVATSAKAELIAVDGGLGIYDTVNNVTWTSDANLMATQEASYSGGPAAYVAAVIAASGGVVHDTPNSIFDPSGTYTLSMSDFSTTGGAMTWWGAQAWVHYLNVIDYGGSSQWALPTTVDSESSVGYPNGLPGTTNSFANIPQSTGQLAQLFYGNLGQVPGSPISITHNSAYALFSNVPTMDPFFWSGTEFSGYPENLGYYAWSFDSDSGIQTGSGKNFRYYSLAVSAGELGSPVPLPAAAWLLLSGLGGLNLMRRRLLPCQSS
jgi:hypothetical protein